MSKVLDSEGAEKMRSQFYGWISGAWQKQPMVMGFSDTKAESISDTNLDAGVNYLDGAQVPAGEVWVVKYAGVYYVGTAPSKLRIAPNIDAVSFDVLTVTSPSANIWYTVTLGVVMGQGDYMRAIIEGATAGDTALLRWYGVKIDIDQ